MCRKVSVITVVYNAQTCIQDTIRSVLAQNYEDFEYIIKDGNSSDHTNDVIDKMIQSSPRKQMIQHIITKDKGIYDAMNEAVKYASGEWIIFMNAGDEFYNEDVISNVFSMLHDKNAGVLYGHALLKLAKNRGIVMIYDLDIMQGGGSICHQAIFERRELLILHPFNTDFKILSDKDHFLTLTEYGVKFEKINVIVVKEDQNGVSSVDHPQIYREANLIGVKHSLTQYRQHNIQIGKIKMLLKKMLPQFQEYVMIKKALERNK